MAVNHGKEALVLELGPASVLNRLGAAPCLFEMPPAGPQHSNNCSKARV